METERLSDRVTAMIEDALDRTVAVGETIDAIDFALTIMATPQGPHLIGVIYIAVKGPIIGQVLSNADIVLDLSMIATQRGVDERVRASLESIRQQKANLLILSNGHGPKG